MPCSGFLEHCKFIVRLPRQAGERILHVEFEKFEYIVGNDLCRPYEGVYESHFFRFRIEDIVVVQVVEGIHPVQRILDVPYGEETPVVGLGRRDGTFLENDRIVIRDIEAYRGAFERGECVAVRNRSCQIHRIHCIACGEGYDESRIDIALVVVRHGLPHVQYVGAVGIEFSVEGHYDAFPADFVYWFFLHRR